jgi:hypothetical protein
MSNESCRPTICVREAPFRVVAVGRALGSLSIAKQSYPKGDSGSAGRVRGWRHNLGVADPLLSVSCESASVPSPCLVSIPCHIEPDMRFSLIRLSDNLLLGVFKTSIVPDFSNLPQQVKPLHVCLLALKYSLRWSSCDLSCGVIGLSACTVTYFLAEPG